MVDIYNLDKKKKLGKLTKYTISEMINNLLKFESQVKKAYYVNSLLTNDQYNKIMEFIKHDFIILSAYYNNLEY